MGLGLRLRLIWDELYLHAPQDAAPGYIRFGVTLSATIDLPLALAAHEADRLTVPIVHEVERNAARQIQRQCRGELKKAVTEVGRNYVLMGHKRQQSIMTNLGWGSGVVGGVCVGGMKYVPRVRK
jgi:hypothetical protein